MPEESLTVSQNLNRSILYGGKQPLPTSHEITYYYTIKLRISI